MPAGFNALAGRDELERRAIERAMVLHHQPHGAHRAARSVAAVLPAGRSASPRPGPAPNDSRVRADGQSVGAGRNTFSAPSRATSSSIRRLWSSVDPPGSGNSESLGGSAGCTLDAVSRTAMHSGRQFSASEPLLEQANEMLFVPGRLGKRDFKNGRLDGLAAAFVFEVIQWRASARVAARSTSRTAAR